MWVVMLNFVPTVLLGMYLLTRKRLDPFEPVIIALSFLALKFAIFGFGLMAIPGNNAPQLYLQSLGISQSAYLVAATVEILAFMTFLLGYGMRPIQGTGRTKVMATQSKTLSGPVVSLLIGALAALSLVGLIRLIDTFSIDLTSMQAVSKKRFVDVGEGQISSAAGYVRWLASLAQYAILLYLARILAVQRSLSARQWIVMTVLLVMALLPPFLTSSRTALLTALFSVLVVFHYLGRPFTFKGLAIIGLAGVVLLAVMGELRSMREGGPVQITGGTVVEQFAVREDAGFLLTARIIESMPQDWEFQNGMTFAAWVFAPVPRSVWAEKPAISLGQDVKVKLFGRSAERGGGVPPSSVGEFFINFGLLSFILSPLYTFFGGWMTRSIYHRLIVTDGSAFSVFVYAVLFIQILPNFFWTQFSYNMVQLGQMLTLFILIVLATRVTVKKIRF